MVVRQRLDPITLEVISKALISIADENRASLIKSSYSTNIKERQDCSSAVMDAHGQVICIGEESTSVHMSSFMFTGPEILRRCPQEAIREGDMFMVNDVYRGGPSHMADITFVSPVFWEGELIAFVGNTGHWPDMGGKAPGQCALGDATEIYQEGIRIPPVRLYRAGELQKELLEILLLNVRDGDDRAGDVRAHVGAVKLAERRLKELAARYEKGMIPTCMEELIRLTELKTRHAIAQLPEGEYEAGDFMDDDMDSDEPIPIKVKITIRHQPQPSITLDFTGTGKAARWGINNPYHGTASAVYWVMRSILDPDIPGLAGFQRCLDIIIPKGTILNCEEPSPVGARSELLYQIPDMPFRALAAVVPRKIVAGNHGVHGIGFSNQGEPPFIYYETVAGGGGARTTKDGIDGVHCASNLPIEAMEMAFPIIADRLEYIQDSEGAGRFRGGLGIQKEYHMTGNNYLSIHSNRHKFPAAGLLGGGDAIPTKVVRNPHSEEPQIMPRQGTFIPANKETVVSLMVGGGGGYGNPFQRDPELVLWDVVNGKVSPERARTTYGVALDLENRRVDQEETQRLRSSHKAP